MSAFVVEDRTINGIISWLMMERDSEWMKKQIKEKTGFDIMDKAQAEQLGRAMLMLNIQAVNERYNDNSDATAELEDYKFRMEIHINKIMALKALNCLVYQCSEGNVPESELYKTLEYVKNSWAMDIIRSLPEYDKAEVWR